MCFLCVPSPVSKPSVSGEITAERYSSYIEELWPKIIKKQVDENGAVVLRYPSMKQRTWLNRCACCSWMNDTDVYVLGDKQWGYMDVVEYEGNDNILEMARAESDEDAAKAAEKEAAEKEAADEAEAKAAEKPDRPPDSAGISRLLASLSACIPPRLTYLPAYLHPASVCCCVCAWQPCRQMTL